MIKTLATAAIMMAGSVTSISAATLNGTFTIDIYNYNSNGNSDNADATAANVAANAANLVKTITYTGLIDFTTTDDGDPPTIFEFLSNAGGVFDGTGLDILVSSGGFGVTTLLDITGSFATAVDGVISHDDGITLLDGSGNTIVASADPTVQIDTGFSASAGDFRLIYSAANGSPEVLNVDVDVAAVPVPAAGLLLLGALGALGLRRRKAA